jgi:hypothetical protein
LDACQNAARLQEDHHWSEFDLVVDNLWSSRFTWTNGRLLSEFVRSVVTDCLRHNPHLAPAMSVEDLIDEVKLVLHVVTDQACSADPSQDFGEENAARGLDPNAGIIRAVERVISQHKPVPPA